MICSVLMTFSDLERQDVRGHIFFLQWISASMLIPYDVEQPISARYYEDWLVSRGSAMPHPKGWDPSICILFGTPSYAHMV